ncbi:MAG: HAMP domain-containing sensor histidine kinase [Bacteroidota bacterium]|nr:HAMP domain-containing histidine kinase [Candidatus Kapabacteria bacterium]MDW8220417.1 HAMP domain-containing sensor histidine kinase [Bacteroidota bacterium]
MPTSPEPQSVFRVEEEFLADAQRISATPTDMLDIVTLHNAYRTLTQRYETMLREVTQLTRISDFTQTKLIRLQHQLEKALAESRENLHKAEEANKRKTELLSVVAHDLKSPLATVLAAVRLMEMGDIAPDEFSETGSRIRETCKRMIDLIESLLASSALEMGKMRVHKSTVDAQEVLQTIIDQNLARAAAKSQRLEMHAEGEDFTLFADKVLLQQVLENFISNAIKYSAYGTTVVSRVIALPDVIRFEVQDQGPGLSDEDKQKLFGFFQRLSARPTGGESSHGVGLAITKRVVELHRGRIWVESQHGRGATFIVVLPRREHEEVHEGEESG